MLGFLDIGVLAKEISSLLPYEESLTYDIHSVVRSLAAVTLTETAGSSEQRSFCRELRCAVEDIVFSRVSAGSSDAPQASVFKKIEDLAFEALSFDVASILPSEKKPHHAATRPTEINGHAKKPKRPGPGRPPRDETKRRRERKKVRELVKPENAVTSTRPQAPNHQTVPSLPDNFSFLQMPPEFTPLEQIPDHKPSTPQTISPRRVGQSVTEGSATPPASRISTPPPLSARKQSASPPPSVSHNSTPPPIPENCNPPPLSLPKRPYTPPADITTHKNASPPLSPSKRPSTPPDADSQRSTSPPPPTLPEISTSPPSATLPEKSTSPPLPSLDSSCSEVVTTVLDFGTVKSESTEVASAAPEGSLASACTPPPDIIPQNSSPDTSANNHKESTAEFLDFAMEKCSVTKD